MGALPNSSKCGPVLLRFGDAQDGRCLRMIKPVLSLRTLQGRVAQFQIHNFAEVKNFSYREMA